MQLLPLTILSPATFQDTESDQTLTFFPDDHRFHWQGGNLEKLGTYQVINEQDTNYLELRLNFRSEERYIFTMLNMDNGQISAFTLKERPGKVMEFRKP